MHVDLFYHFFNFFSVKTDTNKNRLILINLKESEAPKRQIPVTWSAMWLSNFEFNVIWTVFQVFWRSILIFKHYGSFLEFPWLQNGFIRCKRWLKFALLPYDTKMPYLIDSEHYFARLSVEYFHIGLKRETIKPTLIELRQKFWICISRGFLRKIL